jgi:hypothetical protein
MPLTIHGHIPVLAERESMRELAATFMILVWLAGPCAAHAKGEAALQAGNGLVLNCVDETSYDQTMDALRGWVNYPVAGILVESIDTGIAIADSVLRIDDGFKSLIQPGMDVAVLAHPNIVQVQVSPGNPLKLCAVLAGEIASVQRAN